MVAELRTPVVEDHTTATDTELEVIRTREAMVRTGVVMDITMAHHIDSTEGFIPTATIRTLFILPGITHMFMPIHILHIRHADITTAGVIGTWLLVTPLRTLIRISSRPRHKHIELAYTRALGSICCSSWSESRFKIVSGVPISGTNGTIQVDPQPAPTSYPG